MLEQIVYSNTKEFDNETEILRFDSSIRTQLSVHSLDHMTKLKTVILSENMIDKLSRNTIPDRDIVLVLPKGYDHEIGNEIPRRVAVVVNNTVSRYWEKIHRDLHFVMKKITDENRTFRLSGWNMPGYGLDDFYIQCVMIYRCPYSQKREAVSDDSFRSFDKYFSKLNGSRRNLSQQMERQMMIDMVEDENRKERVRRDTIILSKCEGARIAKLIQRKFVDKMLKDPYYICDLSHKTLHYAESNKMILDLLQRHFPDLNITCNYLTLMVTLKTMQ